MVFKKSNSLFILFIAIIMLWQCQEKEKKEEGIRLITVHGSNVGRFLDFDAGFSPLDSLGYVSLLTRHNDWLYIDDFIFPVRGDLPDTLRVKELDSLLYVNENLSAISISEDRPSISFFNQLTEEEISKFQTIQFEKPISDSIKPYLKKIGLINPRIDIVFLSENDSVAFFNRDLSWLSKYFQPRGLILVNEMDSTSLSSLVNFPSLETLLITLPVKGESYVPHLPHLKEIILYNETDSTSFGSEFFKQNPDIESLKIIDEGDGNMDWGFLNELKNLRNLYIQSESIFLNDIYKHHPHLKSLHLRFSEDGSYISDIFKKNKLKWLSINQIENPDPLARKNLKVFQDSFPELEYLEFKNNDSLLDYRNFKNFKKLKYLTVFGDVGLDTTLYHLNHLRYLSLSNEFLNDSVNRVKTQKALPNTIITPNSGACLGSGWLLLIIPLAGLWFYLLMLKKNRVND